jgi:type VI secretion system protein ImpA
MQLRDDLLEPIPGDHPGGEDLRYEPIYDQIKLARTEEDDIPLGDWQRERKTADFRQVIELTQTALATQTKDLQLAAWLAEALLREEGFSGFHEGLELVRELLTRFWDHLYPEVEDDDVEFRATPLEWLAGYLELPVKLAPLTQGGHSLLAYLEAQAVGYESEDDSHEQKTARAEAIEEGKVTPEQFDAAFDATPKAWYKETVAAIEACLATIEALDAAGDELFGDFAPSYSKLKDDIAEVQRVAQKLLDRKLETDPDPPEPEPAVEVMESDAGDSGPGTGSTSGISAVPTSRADAAARIGHVAKFLRSQSPRDPAPYALLRGYRWAEVRAGGVPPDPRLLEAPPTQVRTRLKGLLLDENWPALLEAGEDVMATAFGRGWLDLQRYVMTALTRLGDQYDVVRHVIHGALSELLREVPSLADATLMDDSPTANRETQGWLLSEGILDGEAAGVDRPRPRSSGPSISGVPQLVQQARNHVREGKTDQAVALLLQASERASHAREAFLSRSEAAAIMVDQDLAAVARPILDDMLELVERHSLDTWEAGDLVARPLGLLYRVQTATGEDADDLYERICRLDPVQALRLRSGDRTGTTEAGQGVQDAVGSGTDGEADA